MSSMMRVRFVAIVVIWVMALRAVPASASGVEPEEPVPVDALKKGLMTVLGDSFEYLGGEVGWTKARIGSWEAERFWFAKVRPKVAGEFAVSYTIRFEFPDDVKKKWRTAERATYVIPMRIGARGAPRVVLPLATWGGSTYPHANVDDTLLIPIHVDRFCRNHVFAAVGRDAPSVAAFFHVAGERCHEEIMRHVSEKQVVRNDVADRLDLLSAWGKSSINRSLTEMHCSLTAYLEFKQAADFNLAGRLADEEEAVGDKGKPFRVLPKDQSITVVLEHLDYVEHTGNSTTGGSGSVPSGTIQARVGDRVVLSCGGYQTPAKEKVDFYRRGVVMALAFKPLASYTLEPMK